MEWREFLGRDFISINKQDKIDWEEIKHIVISLINDYYSSGHEYVINHDVDEDSKRERSR